MNNSLAGNLVQTMVVLMAVIALANISLKYLNKKIQGKTRVIQIVEKVPISGSSSMAIVKIAGGVYLMSLSDSGNSIMKELDQEEIGSVWDLSKDDDQSMSARGLLQAIVKRGKSIE